jgi:hypothetical protein
MATLLEIYNQKATNADLRNRVAAAIGVSAWDVFAEDSPSPARLAWAKDAVMNADNLAGQWMWAVCGNAAIQAANFNPPDSDIQYVVNTLRDDYAV